MPTPKTKARATRRVSIKEKLALIEASLSDLRAMVNSHCGEQAIKTARIAGIAAADEILEGLPQKKRPGPQLWNEFLKNYMKQQESSGRKLTRPQAMAEAGPNYRKKYGVTKKVSKAVQPTPARVSPVKSINTLSTASTLEDEEERNGNAVENLRNRNAVENVRNANAVENVRNTNAVENVRNANAAATVRNANAAENVRNANAVENLRNANSAANVRNANAPQNANNQSKSRVSNRRPNQVSNQVETTKSETNVFKNRMNNQNVGSSTNLRPNTTYYGYEDEGVGENSVARKVVIDGEDYFMTDQDRGLFKRSGEDMGEWIGYLEPGGHIRYTNSPANA